MAQIIRYVNPDATGAGTGLTEAAAGNDTEVQYNDGGSLGASPDLTFNAATTTLAVAGTAQTKRLLAGGISA